MVDLAALSDEELVTLCMDVNNEQRKRQRLVQIPEQIAELSDYYRRDGGDPVKLEEAIVPKPEPEPTPVEPDAVSINSNTPTP